MFAHFLKIFSEFCEEGDAETDYSSAANIKLNEVITPIVNNLRKIVKIIHPEIRKKMNILMVYAKFYSARKNLLVLITKLAAK